MNIHAKLTAGFLTVTLVPLAAVSLYISSESERVLIRRTLAQLESIAKINESRFVEAVAKYREGMALIASRTQLRLSLESYAGSGSQSERKRIEKIISDAAAQSGSIRLVTVYDLDGHIVATAGQATVRPRISAAILDQVLGGAVLEQYDVDATGGLILNMTGPLDLNGRAVGVVRLLIDPRELAAITSDFTGLGRSGETLLARRLENGDAQFLTPLRFGDGKVLSHTVPRQHVHAAITHALDGREGLHQDTTDYRGIKVFAAARYLPGQDWGVVTKMDRDEVVEPVARQKNAMMVAFLFASSVALVFSLILSRLIARPVVELATIARRIGEGETGLRAPRRTTDEVGELADAFNSMTEKLAESHDLLEHRVVARTRELATRNAELEQFAYVASHDLQEPLRKIQTFANKFRTEFWGTLDDGGRSHLQRIQAAADRMRMLVEDLLMLTRVSNAEYSIEAVDIPGVVSGVKMDLEQQVAETGAVIEFFEMPTIEADPAQLRQLFQNLIGNALKFRHPDRAPHIRITGRLLETETLSTEHMPIPGEICEITIEDNGIGFESQFTKLVFEPFKRLHNAATYAGTGIGLAICRRIVERHDGEIYAEQGQSEGARFVIRLPVRRRGEIPTSDSQDVAERDAVNAA